MKTKKIDLFKKAESINPKQLNAVVGGISFYDDDESSVFDDNGGSLFDDNGGSVADDNGGSITNDNSSDMRDADDLP